MSGMTAELNPSECRKAKRLLGTGFLPSLYIEILKEIDDEYHPEDALTDQDWFFAMLFRGMGDVGQAMTDPKNTRGNYANVHIFECSDNRYLVFPQQRLQSFGGSTLVHRRLREYEEEIYCDTFGMTPTTLRPVTEPVFSANQLLEVISVLKSTGDSFDKPQALTPFPNFKGDFRAWLDHLQDVCNGSPVKSQEKSHHNTEEETENPKKLKSRRHRNRDNKKAKKLNAAHDGNVLQAGRSKSAAGTIRNEPKSKCNCDTRLDTQRSNSGPSSDSPTSSIERTINKKPSLLGDGFDWKNNPFTLSKGFTFSKMPPAPLCFGNLTKSLSTEQSTSLKSNMITTDFVFGDTNETDRGIFSGLVSPKSSQESSSSPSSHTQSSSRATTPELDKSTEGGSNQSEAFIHNPSKVPKMSNKDMAPSIAPSKSAGLTILFQAANDVLSDRGTKFLETHAKVPAIDAPKFSSGSVDFKAPAADAQKNNPFLFLVQTQMKDLAEPKDTTLGVEVFTAVSDGDESQFPIPISEDQNLEVENPKAYEIVDSSLQDFPLTCADENPKQTTGGILAGFNDNNKDDGTLSNAHQQPSSSPSQAKDANPSRAASPDSDFQNESTNNEENTGLGLFLRKREAWTRTVACSDSTEPIFYEDGEDEWVDWGEDEDTIFEEDELDDQNDQCSDEVTGEHNDEAMEDDTNPTVLDGTLEAESIKVEELPGEVLVTEEQSFDSPTVSDHLDHSFIGSPAHDSDFQITSYEASPEFISLLEELEHSLINDQFGDSLLDDVDLQRLMNFPYGSASRWAPVKQPDTDYMNLCCGIPSGSLLDDLDLRQLMDTPDDSESSQSQKSLDRTIPVVSKLTSGPASVSYPFDYEQIFSHSPRQRQTQLLGLLSFRAT